MTDNEGFRLFMVLTEVFKNELCKGFEPKTVVNVLLNAGWLKPYVMVSQPINQEYQVSVHPGYMYLLKKFGT